MRFFNNLGLISGLVDFFINGNFSCFFMVPCIFQKLPSQAVNIRAIERVRYTVIDKKKNEVLEEIEESKAFFQVLTSTY